MNSDPRVIRKYRAFLGIELKGDGSLSKHEKAIDVEIDGVSVRVLPLEKPIYITLGYTPAKAMKWNRDSEQAQKDALDRARTLYLRENPDDAEDTTMVLLDLHFLKQFIREHDPKVAK